MQSVNAILAFTLQIYAEMIFSKKKALPLDKTGKAWYNNKVNENKAERSVLTASD